MKEECCKNYICLNEGWICNELQKPISEVKYCPEDSQELNMNYRKLVECCDIVKFLVDDNNNVLAVKSFGQDLTVKDLFEERVK